VDTVDARLEAMLLEAEPAIRNEGFSEAVMTAVRSTGCGNAKAGRWTVAGTAVVAPLLTALIAAPLDGAFSSWMPGSGYATSAVAVIFLAFVAVPAAWVFYSE
jgi:hypothetical protein